MWPRAAKCGRRGSASPPWDLARFWPVIENAELPPFFLFEFRELQ